MTCYVTCKFSLIMVDQQSMRLWKVCHCPTSPETTTQEQSSPLVSVLPFLSIIYSSPRHIHGKITYSSPRHNHGKITYSSPRHIHGKITYSSPRHIHGKIKYKSAEHLLRWDDITRFYTKHKKLIWLIVLSIANDYRRVI